MGHGDGNRTDLLDAFLEALHQTPIPTSPPRHDSYLETLGLNLLAIALRLEHIDRVADALTLTDANHMTRTVSIDVNLGALAPERLRALRPDPGGDGDPTAAWLPVARHSRSHIAPVVVRDGGGEVVPHMTQVQTCTALAHGMAKAFRMFLDADPRTEDEAELLHLVSGDLHRSRWLIEATIADLITIGGLRRRADGTGARGHRATDAPNIRAKAEEAIRELFDAGSPFLRLLDVASSDYLLVTEMPTEAAHCFITYEAPVMPAKAHRHGARVGLRDAFQHEFTVEYRTVVPRAVDSYHVTLEVPQDVDARWFFLTSNVDQPAMRALTNDMRALARQYEDLRAASPKLLELELQAIASRLAEFGRRRQRDLASFIEYVRRDHHYREPTRSRPPADDHHVLTGERALVSELARFAHRYESGHYRKLADDPDDDEAHGEDLLPPQMLLRLADELDDAELEQDVGIDNDPRENVGHAHWQRRPFGAKSQPVEPVEVTVYVALAAGATVAGNAAKLLLTLIALVVGFGVILEPQLFADVPVLGALGRLAESGAAGATEGPLSSADAIVAILLLAPSLIISRLRLGSRWSVLARINLLPRYLAYISVAVTGALALAVASVPAGNLTGPFVVAIGGLVLLSVLLAADWLARVIKRQTKVAVTTVTPAWLIREMHRGPVLRRRRAAVGFSTVGSDDHA